MPSKNHPGYGIRGMINTTRNVFEMDFDLLVGDHAGMGNNADVRFYLDYLEQLYNSVLIGMRECRSLETLQ